MLFFFLKTTIGYSCTINQSGFQFHVVILGNNLVFYELILIYYLRDLFLSLCGHVNGLSFVLAPWIFLEVTK